MSVVSVVAVGQDKDALDKVRFLTERTAYREVDRLTRFEKAIKDRLLLDGVTIDMSALNRNLVGGGAIMSYEPFIVTVMIVGFLSGCAFLAFLVKKKIDSAKKLVAARGNVPRLIPPRNLLQLEAMFPVTHRK